MSVIDWLKGATAKPSDVPTGPGVEPEGSTDAVSFSIRESKDSVTINGLDPEWVEYVKRLAAAEGDPPSVFMRKRLQEGFGAYLAGKNRNAWKAYRAIGEARESF